MNGEAEFTDTGIAMALTEIAEAAKALHGVETHIKHLVDRVEILAQTARARGARLVASEEEVKRLREDQRTILAQARGEAKKYAAIEEDRQKLKAALDGAHAELRARAETADQAAAQWAAEKYAPPAERDAFTAGYFRALAVSEEARERLAKSAKRLLDIMNRSAEEELALWLDEDGADECDAAQIELAAALAARPEGAG
jgi:chromosome segregation ATPase